MIVHAYLLQDFAHRPYLADVPVPTPGTREVRVRVRASSVNPVDGAIAAGFFRSSLEHRLPAILGRDLAGTVEAVGEEVTAWRVGDEVVGMVKRDHVGDGTFAEFVVVPEDRFIVARPRTVPVADAGALGLAGVTALQCLDQLALPAGAVLFVHGATGGVGAFALQMARHAGLRVIATARPGEEHRHVRALGAADTVDWSQDDLPRRVRMLAAHGVDGAIDLVSRTPADFAAIAMITAVGGAVVSTLGQAGGVPGRRTENVHSDGDPRLLSRVVDLVAAGHVSVPLVDEVPLPRIGAAFDALAGGPLGKIGVAIPS